jgi:hypothetical protein
MVLRPEIFLHSDRSRIESCFSHHDIDADLPVRLAVAFWSDDMPSPLSYTLTDDCLLAGSPVGLCWGAKVGVFCLMPQQKITPEPSGSSKVIFENIPPPSMDER